MSAAIEAYNLDAVSNSSTMVIGCCNLGQDAQQLKASCVAPTCLGEQVYEQEGEDGNWIYERDCYPSRRKVLRQIAIKSE